MTLAGVSNTGAVQTISKLLKDKELQRVLIIDDAFDSPKRDDFSGTELADFWGELDPEDDAQSELLTSLLGQCPESEDDIDDRAVEILYENRNELGPIQTLFDKQLRVPLERKHSGLDSLINHLRELGLDVRTSGTNVTFSGPSDIIFLDYYLGPRSDLSVNLSSEGIARQLHSYPIGEEKPLIVLMSSYEDVARRAERFRENTGIVGGMFYFVPKSDLSDQVKLLLNLDMLAATLPAGHQIQQFIDVVESKCSSIMEQFISAIKRLNLDDYVYIQRLSLQADGHPLGDYLLWLYSAYFGYLLFERGLKEERRSLDEANFQGWVPSHAVPSKQLTSMYFTALFDTTVGPHDKHHPRWRSPQADSIEVTDGAGELSASHLTEIPRHGDTKTPADGSNTQESREAGDPARAAEVETLSEVDQQLYETANVPENLPVQPIISVDARSRSSKQNNKDVARQLPYFNMGDLFLNDSTLQLLMVLNPACDLEFVPDDLEGTRLLDPSDSLVLIPGTLEELEKISAAGNLRTELFEHNGQRYWVQWHPKRVRTITFGEADQWLLKNKFTRVARLRVPFSLQIQHRFAADFTRVGVPVPPPFYRSLLVQLFKKGEAGDIVAIPLSDPNAEAFVMQTNRDGDKCVLTTGLVLALQRYLEEMSRADSVPALGDAPTPEETKRHGRAQKRLQNARRFRDDFIAWREMSVPFDLPKAGENKCFDKTGVILGYEVPTVGKWTYDSLLMVRISEIVRSVEDIGNTHRQAAAGSSQIATTQPSRSNVTPTGSSTIQLASDKGALINGSLMPISNEQLNNLGSDDERK
jgi:hypothetical protein